MTPPCTAAAHRWHCDPPTGSGVLARCRHCGSERTFPAFLDTFDYGSVPRHIREKAGAGLVKGISYVGYSDGIAR